MTDDPLILIVDDDPMIRLLVNQVLQSRGYTVVEAENGQQGLAQYQATRPDLVLLDVMMPEMDGFSCLQAMRALAGESLPIVMMTAMEDPQAVEQSFRLGATDFIGKPIQWQLLPHRLGYVLRSHHATQNLIKQQTLVKQSEQRFRDLVENISGEYFLYSHDTDCNFTYLGPSVELILGYKPEELLRNCFDIVTDNPINQLAQAHTTQCLTGINPPNYEVEVYCKDGRRRLLSLSETAQFDDMQQVIAVNGLAHDITERKAAEAQIEYLARHDPLTNLPNRSLLRDRFEQAIAHAIRNASLVGLLFLDLDHFKNINDTRGHDIGDRLLQGIAERLCQCVREVDTVCRQGGDEFIIILTDIPEIETITQIALKILNQLHEPFVIEGITLRSSFSIGVSLYPNDGLDFQSLLNKADVAMYAAKNQGRNTFRYFSADMNQATIERITIENGLRLAMPQNEFSLHYQPQYALHDHKIIGAEALLRWQTEAGEMIPPAKFIPIAEEIGMIVPISDWVLREACRQTRRWHDAGLKLQVAVNISVLLFKQGKLLDTVQAALAESGLEPQYLELELTESVLMIDTVAVIDIIGQLRALGVSLAIDDFGTGYSSLSYLKRFAVDKLKIDQSFIRDLSSGKPQDAAIVQAILQLGETLGLHTLAEGVETQAQVDLLLQLGCNKAQGYYWHKPLPADEFERLFIHS